jgi:hypothetical protein
VAERGNAPDSFYEAQAAGSKRQGVTESVERRITYSELAQRADAVAAEFGVPALYASDGFVSPLLSAIAHLRWQLGGVEAQLSQVERAIREIAERPCRTFPEPGESCLDFASAKLKCDTCLARAALHQGEPE